jgi:1-acyl-sn-glycerol-3-phosphate acyltransferase
MCLHGIDTHIVSIGWQWKQLEDNPVTKLLFRQCGFIPVQMADNGNGNDNEYDMSSFRTLLKETKQAFADGFDIGILPEGQLNPNPETGLLPIYSGAYTLARMSKRPIHMMAVHGINNLWHPIHGMECTSRNIKVRAYPHGRKFTSNEDFTRTFTKVVGHFGQFGEDVQGLKECLDGSEWKGMVPERAV